MCAYSISFHWGYQRNGIPFSSLWLKYGGYDVDPDLFAYAQNQAQSIYFAILVIMQLGNMFATRTRRLSILQQPPLGNPRTSNWRLFPAGAFAVGAMIFFNYVPVRTPEHRAI